MLEGLGPARGDTALQYMDASSPLLSGQAAAARRSFADRVGWVKEAAHLRWQGHLRAGMRPQRSSHISACCSQSLREVLTCGVVLTCVVWRIIRRIHTARCPVVHLHGTPCATGQVGAHP